MPVDADHFEFALLLHEESIKEEAEKQFSQEGRPETVDDLPVIDPDEEETWEAERKYEEMKRKAI